MTMITPATCHHSTFPSLRDDNDDDDNGDGDGDATSSSSSLSSSFAAATCGNPVRIIIVVVIVIVTTRPTSRLTAFRLDLVLSIVGPTGVANTKHDENNTIDFFRVSHPTTFE
jgi:hypothetical protein